MTDEQISLIVDELINLMALMTKDSRYFENIKVNY